MVAPALDVVFKTNALLGVAHQVLVDLDIVKDDIACGSARLENVLVVLVKRMLQ